VSQRFRITLEFTSTLPLSDDHFTQASAVYDSYVAVLRRIPNARDAKVTVEVTDEDGNNPAKVEAELGTGTMEDLAPFIGGSDVH
jgi:hypothetical protein